jgi:hypothetical protein
MNSEVWGPPFWFTLHTISMTYPLHPNTVTKKKYYELITNLPLFLPHSEIGNHFAKLLDEYPVEPYLSSRLTFMKWMHFIHNKINLYLGKPEILFSVFLESYHKLYVPKEIIDKEKNVWNKRYIEISVIAVILLLVIYYWKK